MIFGYSEGVHEINKNRAKNSQVKRSPGYQGTEPHGPRRAEAIKCGENIYLPFRACHGIKIR